MITTARRIQEVEEYYFSKKLQEVRSLDTADLPVINLGIGSPDRAPAANVVERLYDTAKVETNHGYQSYKGVPALRKAIADFNRSTYGVELDPEREILPLMGSKEGIMHISLAFVDEGDTVLIPDPGYPTYASVSKLVGAKTQTYRLRQDRGWAIDFDSLEKIDLSKVKVMWVNSPHMPTGSVMSAADMARVINLARKYNFLVVNDNPYSLVLNNNPSSIFSIDGAKDVAFELNSLSKSHNMAGWRVGWVAGNAHHVDAVLKVKSNMDSGMFLGIQQAAIEALKCDQDWYQKLNAVYADRKEKAKEILQLLNCEFDDDQVGLFVWARVPDEISDVEQWIDSILYGTKVFITPGFIFGEGGSRFIRISLCADEVSLQRAKDRIQAWVEKSVDSNHKMTRV